VLQSIIDKYAGFVTELFAECKTTWLPRKTELSYYWFDDDNQ
jgi:hypothetical protein